MDYATLTPSHDFGVVATTASFYLPSQLNTPDIVYACKNVGNFTVSNGSILQGQAEGYSSLPVYANSLSGLTIDGVQTLSAGIDTGVLDATWSNHITIVNSTFRSTADNVIDRMRMTGAMLYLGRTYGPVLVENNTLLDSPQIGIYASTTDGLVIRGNTIQSNAMATDCYGILLASVHNFEISDNTITAAAGKSSRGILLDYLPGVSDGTSSDGEIFGNYVDIREKANREFGTGGIEATAFRMRTYMADGWTGIHIHDNTFIARTAAGAAEAHAAIGLRVTTMVDNSVVDTSNLIENNLIKAIVETTNSGNWAHALDIAGISQKASPLFKHNVLESNDVSLAFGSNDGWDDFAGTFVSNTFRKSADGPARSYASITAGYWTGQVHNIQIIDPRYENGATSAIVWSSSGTKDLSLGSLLDVQVQNLSGGALAGAAVRVLDKDGAQVFSGVSDANGLVSGVSVVTTIYRQTGTNPGSITTDARGPFTIQVSLAGYTTSSQTNSLAQSQSLLVQLTSTNGTAGVQITQSGGSTNVTEGGATDSYTVVLSSQPTANVTVTVTPNSQVSVNKTTLTFTTSNWNVAQTVTVSAVDDQIVEGSHTGTITHAVSSSDANYNGLSVAGVTAQITDNDTVGVQITQSGGSTNVTEGGATDSYTVVLSSQPTANVTVTVTPNSQVSVNKTTLTFTTSNWNVAQTVTVSAVDDQIVEGSHTGSITHAVSSGDTRYNGLSVAGVTVQITDNDTAGVQITQSGGSTNVTEGGATDSYTVVLSSQPTANVTVTVTPNSQVSVNKTTLTFTASNWNVAQTVTVTAVDDQIVEGNHTGTITHAVSSGDTRYNGLSVAGVTAQITDNDTAGVQITQSGGSTNVTEGGATDSYTVVLSSQPTANVTVTVTPNSQVSVNKTTLTFTTSNWNVAQTVTVSAVNDQIVEGNHTGTITHAVSSGDTRYNNLSVAGVTAQITDNDTVGVQITQSGGSTNVIEGGATDSYTVVLSSQPTANVTVTVTPNSQVSVNKTTLTFTTSNWNVAQTVTVTAVDDQIGEGPHTGTILHQVSSSDVKFNGLAASSVTVYITDNDAVTGQLTDTTLADFTKGLPSAGVLLTDLGGGAVTLAPTAGSDFTGTTLPSGWTNTIWHSGGTATVNGGMLHVDGAGAYTNATFSAGRSVEFLATFTSDSYQHVGFGVDLNSAPWAIFSTSGGGGLNVRTYNGTTNLNTPISGNFLGSPHLYRIDWNSSGVTYWVDGVVVATHSVAITTAMRPMVSDYYTGGSDLQVDWLRMGPFAASGSFFSRVFDGGGTVSWNTASWTAATPAGTTVTLSVRTGNTPTPDGTWTNFVPLAGSGASIGAVGRYLQYRVDLATGNPGNPDLIPTLNDVTIAFSSAISATLVSNSPVAENSPVDVSLSVTNDPGNLHYSFALASGGLAANYAAAGAANSSAFTFTDNGSYIVYGRILHADNSYTDYTTTVTVNDVAPTATLSNSGPVATGSSVNVNFSNPSDVSAADTAAGFRYSFALSPGSLATTYTAAGTSSSQAFTFASAGIYTVYGRIFDKDSGFADYTTSVAVTGQLTDTTLADFTKGLPSAGVLLTDLGGGAVTLAPTAGSDFTGTTLPSGWTNTIWHSGGTTTVNGGMLHVDGAGAYTNATYSAGRSVEFLATFTSDSYQHAGFGVDLNSAPWAIFSTSGGGGLNVRTNNGTGDLSTPISGNFLGSPHLYRIDWNSSGVTYWVDGVVVATHSVAITTAMRPMVSDYYTGGKDLQVDWLRMGPFAASGSFFSRVFDGGGTVSWNTASWNAAMPAGTTVTLSVRTGNTPTPDGTWTNFVPLAGSGASIGAVGRYLQYRVDLATGSPGNPDLIPTLNDVTIAFSSAVGSGSMAANSLTDASVGITDNSENPNSSAAAQTAASSPMAISALVSSPQIGSATFDVVAPQDAANPLSETQVDNVENQNATVDKSRKDPQNRRLTSETNSLEAILQLLAEQRIRWDRPAADHGRLHDAVFSPPL